MIGFTPGWSYLSGLDEFAAHAAAAEPAAADAGRHHLDRRRADRRAVPRRPERLASAWDGRRSAPISCIAIRSSCWSRATPSALSPVDAKTFAEQDRAAEAGEIVAELIAVMSKLVIASIGPASSVQDGGRPGAQRYGLVPSGADGSAGAGGGEYAGRKRTVRGGCRSRSVRRDVHGARRRGARRAGGRSRNADIAGRAVAIRYVRDACRWRDADARLCPRRFVQLPRDRRRHRGRADVRQPCRQRPRRPRQPLSAPAAGRRRIAGDGRRAARRNGGSNCRPRATRRSAW